MNITDLTKGFGKNLKIYSLTIHDSNTPCDPISGYFVGCETWVDWYEVERKLNSYEVEGPSWADAEIMNELTEEKVFIDLHTGKQIARDPDEVLRKILQC